MLYEPKLLFEHRRECKSFLIAVKLYNLIKTSGFNRDLSIDYLKQIRLHDPELALQISGILPLMDGKPVVFADLFSAYAHGREYFVSYIVTHIDNLMARARSVSDQKISQKLIRLFSVVSGQELQYLIRYREDCNNWSNPRYSINYSIEFFIRRLNFYIKGGVEENAKFMGLYKDFNDKELTNEILANNAVRNLWRHIEQANYLISLIGLCIEAQKSGEWKGFYGKDEISVNGTNVRPFWPNFKEHAEAFTSKYGNVEFTAELKSKKNKIGENPQAWGGVWQVSSIQDVDRLRSLNTPYIVIGGNVFIMTKDGILPQLLRRLQDTNYQRRRIILPASLELHNIFKAREERLGDERKKSINELLAILRDLSGLSMDMAKVVLRLKRMLRKKKVKIVKNISSDANGLLNKSRNPLESCSTYYLALDEVIELIDPDEIKRRLEALYRITRKSLFIARQSLSRSDAIRRIGSNWRYFVQADGSLSAAKTAKIERRRLIFDEHLSLEDLRKLQQLTPNTKLVLNALKILEDYIRLKMKGAYTVEFENLGNLNFSQLQNEKFEIGFAKSAFDRVI